MEPMGCPETPVTANLRCVTSQRGEDLIYIAVEPWNHSYKSFSVKTPAPGNAKTIQYILTHTNLVLSYVKPMVQQLLTK